MLSPRCAARWCALLATVGSLTFAETAGQDAGKPASDGAPAPEKKDKDKKDGGDAEDLARTLGEGDVEPVSRVMGTRIVASAVKPYIHGTLAMDWRWGDGDAQLPNTLELRESHLYLGAHILDIAQPEVFIEVEKKNQTSPPLNLRYGQVDVKVAGELLVVRAGLFLVPFGVYNTDLFLRYNAHFPERPDIHVRLLPGSWSEVGAQLRGRWEWSPGRALQYAVYVTNGQVGDLRPDRAAYDPVYRSLSGAKSFGARVTVQPLDGLVLGLSGYSGALNSVAYGLNLAGVDFIFRKGAFSADGEALWGWRLDPDPVPEGGFYVTAGYKFLQMVEPVLGLTALSTGLAAEDNEINVLAGVNVWPYAERFPTAVLKAAYERDLGVTPGDTVTVMFAIGF